MHLSANLPSSVLVNKTWHTGEQLYNMLSLKHSLVCTCLCLRCVYGPPSVRKVKTYTTYFSIVHLIICAWGAGLSRLSSLHQPSGQKRGKQITHILSPSYPSSLLFVLQFNASVSTQGWGGGRKKPSHWSNSEHSKKTNVICGVTY